MSKWTEYSKEAWGNAWKSGNIGGSIGTIVGGLGDVVSAGVSNSEIKDTSAEESAIKDVAATQFSSGNLDSLLSQFDSSVMSRTNYTGSELRGLTTGQQIGNTFKGIASGAMTGAKIGGPWGAVAGAVVGLGSGIVGAITGNKKARDKAVALNKKAKEANASYLNSYSNSVENTQNTMFNNSLLNITSYGGPLFNHSGDWTNKEYLEGYEYDLDEAEINRLLNLGYEIEYV